MEDFDTKRQSRWNPMVLAVTFEVKDAGRVIIAEALGMVADVIYLTDLEASTRPDVLRKVDALLVRNTAKELRSDELPLIRKARLIQFLSAGIDFIPLHELPPEVPLANNAGAYAEPMAEHALAMALAAAKRLFVEHHNLSQGQFNQFTPNKMLAGRVCGVLGFGGVGTATARLMRCLGMRVHAINRRGVTHEAVDWIGTPDRLDELMAASDVLVISAPLTRSTERVIGARELSLMKDDAIIVNLARGEIVDEGALYVHLEAKPRFTACIDAWWIEPVRHGEFRMNKPFLQLPNVIGSPHNSASVVNSYEIALRRAVENCRRALIGEIPLHLIRADERMS
jgi:phosphoglycerate dehydrogenase-like enzyme